MTEPGHAPGCADADAPPRPDFDWNLRPLMAARHLWKATQLTPLLRQRGVNLSQSQIRRLVTGKPRRLSMAVLSALCDILGCTPNDLITPRLPCASAAGPGTGTVPPPRPPS